MTEVVIAPAAQLREAFCRRFETTARDAIAARGQFACALSGGSVAETFLPALEGAAVDWSRVHVFWGDERAVPPGDAQSNFGGARHTLEQLDVDAAHVHRIRGEDPDLDRAAADYQTTLTALLGTPPALDLVLLGVGPDGHVCSLFPGHAALRERTRFVVAIRDSPKPPPARVTITLPVIAAARLLILGAFGAEKAEVVGTLFPKPQASSPKPDDSSPTPAALALRSAARALVLLDDAAASRITRRR